MSTTTPEVAGRFHFSLWSLFAAVACCAVALTALKIATVGWAITTISLTVGMFIWALLRSVYGTPTIRPFWVGFLLAGGGYLGLLLVLLWCHSWGYQSGYTGRNSLNDLATTESLDFLFRKMNPEIEKIANVASNFSIFESASWTSYPAYPTYSAPTPYWAPTSSIAVPATTAAPPVASTPDGLPVVPAAVKPTGAPEPGAAAAGSALTPVDLPNSPTPAVIGNTNPPTPSSTPEPPNSLETAVSAPTVMPPIQTNPYIGQPIPAQYGDWQTLMVRLHCFPRIGHALYALLFGWIGGLVASLMAAKARAAIASVPTPASPTNQS